MLGRRRPKRISRPLRGLLAPEGRNGFADAAHNVFSLAAASACARVEPGSHELVLANGARAGYELLAGVPPHRGPRAIISPQAFRGGPSLSGRVLGASAGQQRVPCAALPGLPGILPVQDLIGVEQSVLDTDRLFAPVVAVKELEPEPKLGAQSRHAMRRLVHRPDLKETGMAFPDIPVDCLDLLWLGLSDTVEEVDCGHEGPAAGSDLAGEERHACSS
jgi:hypothetical protein